MSDLEAQEQELELQLTNLKDMKKEFVWLKPDDKRLPPSDSILVETRPPADWFVQSVRDMGILQNIIIAHYEDGHYELRAGRKRVLAARLAEDLDLKIPALIIHNADYMTAVMWTLLENHAREKNEIGDLRLARELVNQGYYLEAIARKLNKPANYFRHLMETLGALDETFLQAVEEKRITLPLAKEIAKKNNAAVRDHLKEQLEQQGKLTGPDVRKAKYARRVNAAKKITLPGVNEVENRVELPPVQAEYYVVVMRGEGTLTLCSDVITDHGAALTALVEYGKAIGSTDGLRLCKLTPA